MAIRVAVVGVGNIGSIHARIYHEHPDADLVAVCDIDTEKADAAAERHGCRAFYSVPDLIGADLGLDAVSVATRGEENGGDHFAPTMELLDASIPVLGEKPISNRIDEAAQMVAAAAQANVPYGINLNHRFTPAAARAREWIDDGRLGMLHLINMRMWIRNKTESSPWFHLRALHPHSFDIMRYFCGDVRKVACFVMKGEGRTIWSNAQIMLQFDNDVVGNLVGSYDATGPHGSYGLELCDVAGSKGRFVLEEACQRLTFCPLDSITTEQYQYLGGMRHFDETFASRIGDWVTQIDSGTAPLDNGGSGAEALAAQRIIEAAIESWESSSIVEVIR